MNPPFDVDELAKLIATEAFDEEACRQAYRAYFASPLICFVDDDGDYPYDHDERTFWALGYAPWVRDPDATLTKMEPESFGELLEQPATWSSAIARASSGSGPSFVSSPSTSPSFKT